MKPRSQIVISARSYNCLQNSSNALITEAALARVRFADLDTTRDKPKYQMVLRLTDERIRKRKRPLSGQAIDWDQLVVGFADAAPKR